MYDIGVIVVLPREWETYHRKQMVLAMAQVLGPHGVVVCVNRPLDAVATPLRGPAQVWFKWRTRYAQDLENLHVFRPVLPLHEMIACWLGKRWSIINSRLLKQQMEGFLVRRGIAARHWILWLSNPVHWALPHLMNRMISVYEAYDEYCLTPDGNPRPEVERWERELLKASQVVFVTSDALLRTKGKLHSRVFRMDTGLNFELFERGAQGEEPLDLGAVPHPRAVYVGNFRDWIDVPLLEAVIKALPSVSFVSVGPVESNMRQVEKRLSRQANVFFLGPKTHNLVPRYIFYSDLCLIPMRNNAFTENVSPLKLWEYLALGKPVVSTALPEVARFEKYGVYVAHNVSEFSRCVQEAVGEDRHLPVRELRKELAREHDWQRIVKDLFGVIDRELIPSFFSGTMR